jgi:hypothetical protein
LTGEKGPELRGGKFSRIGRRDILNRIGHFTLEQVRSVFRKSRAREPEIAASHPSA